MRRAVLVSVGLVGLVARCSVLTDLSGLGADAAAPVDGSSSDAPIADGGVDGQADATGNLLTNADFEQGTVGCGQGWTTGGTMTRWDGGHSGQYACLVCGSTVGPFNLFATPRPVTNPASGSSYFGQAYFMMVPDAAINGVGLELYEYFDSGAGTMLSYSYVQGTSQGWQVAQDPAQVAEAGVSIGFEIHASVPDGSVVPGCFVIDDAEMVQQ